MSSTKLGMIDSIIEGEDDETGIIESIPKDKAEDLLEIIRSGMHDGQKSAPSKKHLHSKSIEPKDYTLSSNQSISIADELSKLVKLREQGVLSHLEFQKLKQKLL